jgi:hypothetical protein
MEVEGGVASIAIEKSGVGFDSDVGGMGSNQPRITTQVQPPHKIHPGAE